MKMFYLFFFFWPYFVACGILISLPGIESVPQQWKLPNRPGNSQNVLLVIELN